MTNKINETLSLDEQFQIILNEGVYDKGIFKAVFLAGGPGSGKDYVLSHTLDGHGLTEINSDKALEYLMDKNHLDKKMPDNEEEARNHLRKRAKSVTELKQYLALHGRNGLIINGTGDDHKKVKKIKKGLEGIGYDTSMIMVHSDDEVSRKRNIERGQRGGRSVPEKVRKAKWDAVQEARRHHAKEFGNNYHEYDNSLDHKTAAPEEIKQKKDELNDLYGHMHKFVNTPSNTPKSQKWIATELANKNTLPVPRDGAAKLPHPESNAAKQAAEAGLQYYGQGRYGNKGKVTHFALNDNLTQMEQEKPKDNKPKVKKTKINEEFSAILNESHSFSNQNQDALTLGKEMNSFGNSHDGYTLSNDDIKNMLEEEVPTVDIAGNPRRYLLRHMAAKDAHRNDGTVHHNPNGAGYIVKIKRTKSNDTMDKKSVQKETGNNGSRIPHNSPRIDSSGASGGRPPLAEGVATDCAKTKAQETLLQKNSQGEHSDKNLSISDFRKKIKESLDKGIEPGCSMAASGENMSRDSDKKGSRLNKKVPIEELTGDETTLSIGDQKEDELKKKGINLNTFKSKKVM